MRHGEDNALACDEHCNKALHRDGIKAQLLDKIISPKMDQSIMKAVMKCGRCEAFGSTHVHSLLELMTRRHRFELVVDIPLSAERKGWYHETWLMDDHVCAAGVGDKVEVSGCSQAIVKRLWQHPRPLHNA
jgi:hypothetical protein